MTSDGVTLNQLWHDEDDTYRLVAYETQPLTDSTRKLSLAVPADVDDPVVLSGLQGLWSQVRRSQTTMNVSGSGRREVSEGGGIGGGVITDVAGETVTMREGNDSVSGGTLVIAIYAPID